jgi:hypothetical protein
MKNSASSSPGRVLTTDAVERLGRQLVPKYSQHPAGAAVRRKLQALERNYRFTPRSRRLFEELLGRVGVRFDTGNFLYPSAINPSGFAPDIRWGIINRRRHCPHRWTC